jgi:ketosteroid isomerase-like protein
MSSEPSGGKTTVDVARTFYEAVSAGEVDVIAAVVDEHFSADAAIEWPASLPYGGRVEGAHRLRKMFAAMAGSDVKVGPDALEVLSVTADGDRVAAELTFNWFPPGKTESVASGALELWTFEAAKVTGIRAYYWDTAALVAAMT